MKWGKFPSCATFVVGTAFLFPFRAWCAPGVVLDGSLGASGALPGPNFLITAGMGRQVGTNLFQSFSSFNLTSSESATFTGTGSTGPISNILARVTGGPSSIDGTINSQIAGANLFLLNSAGVLFGPNAQVNVSGSFIVGTADYVGLSDGGKFNTSVGDDSELSSAPVSAFGFLSSTPRPVSFAGSQISMQAGTGLHVIAGDITLDQGRPDGVNEQGTILSAPAGKLTLFSAASAGEVPFSLSSPGGGFSSAANASFGNITVQNQSSIDISGAGGGSVVIRGGKLTVDNSTITSFNNGAVIGGDIALQADQLSVRNGALIGTDAYGTAGAGSVQVNVAGDISVTGNSQISANTETAADGGTVSVMANGNITLDDGGHLIASTDGPGNGGTVFVQAASMNIGSQGSGISTGSDSVGNAGTIEVDVAGAIEMTDNSGIVADTFGGSGGNITIQALQLNMSDLALISANTFSTSSGGNINIETGSLSIQGTDHLALAFNKFLLGFTGITCQSVGPGSAGSISVTTQDLSLSSGAVISTASVAGGNGGPISVTCTQGQLVDQSLITAASLANAGSVRLTAANSFTLEGNSSITASAGYDGGNVTLRVKQLLYLDDSNIEAFAGDADNPQPGSVGGNILIDPQFVILNNSLISANDLAPGGRDGNIANTADFFFTNDSLLHATGTIQTPPPDFELANSLTVLPGTLVDISNRLRESCARSVNHEFSTLTEVGRGGIETSPDELQTDSGASDGPAAAAR